ncbi:hypothetical protein MRX96_015715 [Rhipicephalus microplus]
MLLPRWKQAEETHAVFRMSCLKSLGVVLALQVAAAWATSVTPAPGAAAAAPAVGTAAVNGTPHHAAAESATASAAAAAGHGHFDTTQKTHKCTNVKVTRLLGQFYTQDDCADTAYIILLRAVHEDPRGAYFIFTDGEDGVPCKTRTLDGQVLNGACQQGLCTVKDQAGVVGHSAVGAAAAGVATPASAAGASAAGAAAASGAATPGVAAHPAAVATPAHVAAPVHPAAAATAKHKKA